MKRISIQTQLVKTRKSRSLLIFVATMLFLTPFSLVASNNCVSNSEAHTWSIGDEFKSNNGKFALSVGNYNNNNYSFSYVKVNYLPGGYEPVLFYEKVSYASSPKLVYQKDNNLVLYDGSTDQNSLWEVGVSQGDYKGEFCAQDDGNYVIYEINSDGTRTAKWSTDTSGYFEVANNCKTAPYAWSYSGDNQFTSNNLAFSLNIQNDGNVVLYSNAYDDQVLFSTDSAGKTANPYFVFQEDNNIVLYSNSPSQSVLWSSNTVDESYTGGKLCMQDDGNLVLYDDNGNPKWATNDGRDRFVIQNATNFVMSDVACGNDKNKVTIAPRQFWECQPDTSSNNKYIKIWGHVEHFPPDTPQLYFQLGNTNHNNYNKASNAFVKMSNTSSDYALVFLENKGDYTENPCNAQADYYSSSDTVTNYPYCLVLCEFNFKKCFWGGFYTQYGG
ncbi:MAG: hypothetical protein AAGA27_04695 [Pseudomonadota bacterium]